MTIRWLWMVLAVWCGWWHIARGAEAPKPNPIVHSLRLDTVGATQEASIKTINGDSLKIYFYGDSTTCGFIVYSRATERLYFQRCDGGDLIALDSLAGGGSGNDQDIYIEGALATDTVDLVAGTGITITKNSTGGNDSATFAFDSTGIGYVSRAVVADTAAKVDTAYLPFEDFVKHDGTVAMTDNWGFGNFDLTGGDSTDWTAVWGDRLYVNTSTRPLQMPKTAPTSSGQVLTVDTILGGTDTTYWATPAAGGLDSADVMQIIADSQIAASDIVDGDTVDIKIGSTDGGTTFAQMTNSGWVPSATNSYDLGTTTGPFKWRDAFIDRYLLDVDSSDIVLYRDASIGLEDLEQGGAGSGQVLEWNGSAWAPAEDNTGGTSDTAKVLSTAAGDSVYVKWNAGNVQIGNDTNGAQNIVLQGNGTDPLIGKFDSLDILGDVDFNSNTIAGVPEPAANDQAANKQYVDTIADNYWPKSDSGFVMQIIADSQVQASDILDNDTVGIYIGSADGSQHYALMGTTGWLPRTTNTYDIGAGAVRWKIGYFNQQVNVPELEAESLQTGDDAAVPFLFTPDSLAFGDSNVLIMGRPNLPAGKLFVEQILGTDSIVTSKLDVTTVYTTEDTITDFTGTGIQRSGQSLIYDATLIVDTAELHDTAQDLRGELLDSAEAAGVARDSMAIYDSVYVLYQSDVASVTNGYFYFGDGVIDTIYIDTADAVGGAGGDSALVLSTATDGTDSLYAKFVSGNLQIGNDTNGAQNITIQGNGTDPLIFKPDSIDLLGTFDANNNTIAAVPEPTANDHAANKQYVDTVADNYLSLADSGFVMDVIRDTTYIDSALTGAVVRDTGDVTYLRLDATNDPVTGDVAFNDNNDLTAVERIEAETLFVGDIQMGAGQAADTGVINAAATNPGRIENSVERDAHFGDSLFGLIEVGEFRLAMHMDTAYGTASESLKVSQSVLFRNMGTPDGFSEFLFLESSNTIRFGLPKSGAGLGTYNPRSMIIAGPAQLRDSVFAGSFWGFDSLAMNTSGDGADLGVQNDMQVNGEFFVDTIKHANLDTIEIIGPIQVTDTIIGTVTDIDTNGTSFQTYITNNGGSGQWGQTSQSNDTTIWWVPTGQTDTVLKVRHDDAITTISPGGIGHTNTLIIDSISALRGDKSSNFTINDLQQVFFEDGPTNRIVTASTGTNAISVELADDVDSFYIVGTEDPDGTKFVIIDGEVTQSTMTIDTIRDFGLEANGVLLPYLETDAAATNDVLTWNGTNILWSPGGGGSDNDTGLVLADLGTGAIQQRVYWTGQGEDTLRIEDSTTATAGNIYVKSADTLHMIGTGATILGSGTDVLSVTSTAVVATEPILGPGNVLSYLMVNPVASDDFPFFRSYSKLAVDSLFAIVGGTASDSVRFQMVTYSSGGTSVVDTMGGSGNFKATTTLLASDQATSPNSGDTLQAGEWMGIRTDNVYGAPTFITIQVYYEEIE